ncbi:MAG: PASTA domain-containing protein, partial [Phycisphaerales bacterium]
MTGRRNPKMYLAACLFFVVLASTAVARTFQVPGEYGNIQSAIDAADGGDKIQVAAGTYYEAIDFKGKAIRLYSTAGPGATTINGTGHYHVVQCVSGEGSGTILEGFTITGGKATGAYPNNRGAGMYNDHSSPTVTNCTFNGNSATYGGGMDNAYSNPTVTNCTFSDNSAGNNGGGMCNSTSSPTVTNCTFTRNDAWSGGGMYNDEGSPTVTNCIFSGNEAEYSGGGMFNDNSSPTVTNCTFTGNSADDDGGGMYNYSSSPTVTNCIFSNNSASYRAGGMYNYVSNPTVTSCILWANSAPTDPQIRGDAAVTYSDVEGGWPGTGNINKDPLFAPGTLRLSAGSPCIDAGSNDAVPAGITTDLAANLRFVDDPHTPDTGSGTPPIVDMGAYEFQPAGPPPGTVPNVVGMAMSAATSAIASAGYVVGTTSGQYSDTVPAQYVISQDPAPGTALDPGSAVDLVVSVGPAGPGQSQACCLPDGTCRDLTTQECLAQGGIPQGQGTTCATTDCGQAPADPPVAHYKLDESIGTIAEDSAGDKNGTTYGGPVWLPTGGMMDGALSFDGVDDYVDCGNDHQFDLTEQITVAAWVNITSVPGDYTAIVAKGDTAWRLSTHLSTRRFHFAVCGEPWVNLVGGSTEVGAGEWHHVCGTYDHQEIRLYVDGLLDAMLANTEPIPTNAQNVYIGENAEAPGRFWHGLIDDVRIYDYALSADQIVSLLCVDPPPGDVTGDCRFDFTDVAALCCHWLSCTATDCDRAPDPGLVAHYKLDEGAGNIATDSSGNGHHGTAQNGAPTWVEGHGIYGTAMHWAGQNPAEGWINCGTWNPSAET